MAAVNALAAAHGMPPVSSLPTGSSLAKSFHSHPPMTSIQTITASTMAAMEQGLLGQWHFYLHNACV
jgi:hypothetical protein